MGHSIPISEPPAWLSALGLGLLTVVLGKWIGLDEAAALSLGSTVAVTTSVLIGAPINAALFDALALLILRPVAGLGVWHVTEMLARALPI